MPTAFASVNPVTTSLLWGRMSMEVVSNVGNQMVMGSEAPTIRFSKAAGRITILGNPAHAFLP